jgi:hypothetical protein
MTSLIAGEQGSRATDPGASVLELREIVVGLESAATGSAGPGRAQRYECRLTPG